MHLELAMHDDLHGLAGPFALDALAPDEQRRFEVHLDRCWTCAEEVPGLAATAAMMTAAVADRPPPGLRARVLAEVAETRQAPPLVRSRPVRRPVVLRRVLAAAASLLVLVGVLAVAGSRGSGGDEAVSGEVAVVLAAPDAQVVELRDGGADLLVRLVWSPSEGRAAAVGRELADPGEGKAYALWAIGADGPRPAGLMRPDGEGRLEAVMDADLSTAATLGLTIEPETGSARPTTPVIASGIV
jgi:hypothetical protein